MPALSKLEEKQQRELLERLERAGRADLLRLARQGLAQRRPPFRIKINSSQYLAIRNTTDGGLGAWVADGPLTALDAPETRADVVRRVTEGGSTDKTPRRSVRVSDDDWSELEKEGEPCAVARRIIEEYASSKRGQSPQ